MSAPSDPADPANGARGQPRGLEFPTDFPIKIMGRRDEGFAQAIVEVVL